VIQRKAPFASAFMLSIPHWLGQGWLSALHIGLLLQGLALTILLSTLVMISATFLGFLLGIARHRFSNKLLMAIHTSIRNIPLLIHVLFCYFVLGSLLPEAWMLWLNSPHVLWQIWDLAIAWPSFEFLAAWLAISLYAAAFIAEDLRSGLNTVAAGQWEAARSQGFNYWQTLRWVILPQAFKTAWPPMLGTYLNTIKNTSLTMAIGVMELSYRSRQIDAQTLLTFQAFAIATLLYVVLIIAVQRIFQTRHVKCETERWA
jgi:polar amino acid transport system permease protein